MKKSLSERQQKSEAKAFEKLVGKLEKDFNASTLSKTLEKSGRNKVEFITSGCQALDSITGGGFPRGRITEVSGGESTGKTTLTDTTIAVNQKLGLKCAKVDAEHATDPVYLKTLGVDFDKLIFSQPETGEEAINIVRFLVESGVDLIVVDSVAAMTPKRELENDMDKDTMGLQARMMGKAMRKLSAAVAKHNTCLIFINQLRDKIGVMFGDRDTTPGGKALRYYASLRIKLSNLGSVKGEGGKKVANKIRANIKKSKVGIQGRICEYQIVFGRGIDKVLDIWDTLFNLDIAVTKQKKGKKRTYIADEKFVDYDDFVDRLKEEKGLRSFFKKLIKNHKIEY